MVSEMIFSSIALPVLKMFKMKDAENLNKLYTLYSTQYFDCDENYRLEFYVK